MENVLYDKQIVRFGKMTGRVSMASSYGEDASKQALRSAYITLPTLSPSHQARLDGDVLVHLRMLPEYRACKLLLAFPSQREEADTLGAVKQARTDGKTVAIPTFANDGKITFSLEDGSPLDADETELAASVCLVPGLIFDAQGYRGVQRWLCGQLPRWVPRLQGLAGSHSADWLQSTSARRTRRAG